MGILAFETDCIQHNWLILVNNIIHYWLNLYPHSCPLTFLLTFRLCLNLREIFGIGTTLHIKATHPCCTSLHAEMASPPNGICALKFCNALYLLLLFQLKFFLKETVAKFMTLGDTFCAGRRSFVLTYICIWYWEFVENWKI